MAFTYKTPGVYVVEVATFPPSVAEVGTAIPAFIGVTEKGTRSFPQRVANMMEYSLYFGGPQPEQSIVAAVQDDAVVGIRIDETKKSKNIMYYAMKLYFANGGGPCWIVPAGNYADAAAPTINEYNSALDAIGKEDEPTLLIFPDATGILDSKNYYALANNALMQCQKLGDRFSIVDVIDVNRSLADSSSAFRDAGVGVDLDHAKYGAAYYPYLETNISYDIDRDDQNTNISVIVVDDVKLKALTDARDKATAAHLLANDAKNDAAQARSASDADAANAGLKTAATKAETKAADLDTKAKAADTAVATAEKAIPTQKFEALPSATRSEIRLKVSQIGITLPPSSAIAGVYASVDDIRGVWKSPANIVLSNVSAAAVKITDKEQEDMNVDVTAGKSINAIRAFTGKGTMVWGARTLAGNDNEWRYISVRRFFNMVEESVKKSTYWAVFEANDANTWLKVRAMIENYLFMKWRDGALAGTKAEDAFYVHVGLGETMTAQDILEGRMYVEIGMAVVRPAEFIILKFSHKLQTS